MDRRIQIITSQIEEQFSRELKIPQLARLVNVSTSHLRHLFKSETGLTPTQYLKRLRMQKAQLLLETTFLSVKQISNRVGFSDDTYFSREFKKTYGVAPGRYRQVGKPTLPARRSIASQANK